MANCDKCNQRATQILSVGSQGRTETLCPTHLSQATTPLDAGLIPYQLTGVEGSFSTEQSLGARVNMLDVERAELLAQLDGARHENTRLREILLARLEQHNEDLRNELDAVKGENEQLSKPAAVVEGPQPGVTSQPG
jgi:hypothetical protein